MTEANLHRQIVQYLRLVLPGAVVHHSANEVRRGGRRGHINRAINVGMGVVPGYPDLVIHAPDLTAFIEIKTDSGRLSEAQKALHERLTGMGYQIAVARSLDDVRAALAAWGFKTREKAA